MVDFISYWAQQVIVALIIVVIFELIIPDGKNKKYIKLIMGIFILYVIISPVLKDKVREINLNSLNINVSDTNYKTVSSDVIVDENIEKLYEKKIKDDIENKVMMEGYNLDYISLKVNYEDGDNYGVIENIQINISKSDVNENNKIKVEKVDTKNSKFTNELIDVETENKLKNSISEMYGISIDNILIN